MLSYIFLLRGRKTGKRRPNYAAVFLFLKQFPCKVGNTDSGVIQLRCTVIKSIAVIPLHPLEELVLVALKLCKDLARSLAEQQERNILLYDRSVFLNNLLVTQVGNNGILLCTRVAGVFVFHPDHLAVSLKCFCQGVKI